MNTTPIVRFRELLAQAEQLGIQAHNAFALATTGKELQPAARMVLLKDVDEQGPRLLHQSAKPQGASAD